MRTTLTALTGWLTINALGVLTLAAHNAWTSRRAQARARARYTAEALREAQQRHPARGWLALHNHDTRTGQHTCTPDCPGRLETLYLAPAASVTR